MMKDMIKFQFNVLFLQFQTFLSTVYANFFIYKSNNGTYLLLKTLFLIIFSIPFLFVLTPVVFLTYVLLILKVFCDLAYGILFIVSFALNLIALILGAVVSIIYTFLLIPDYIYAKDSIVTIGDQYK